MKVVFVHGALVFDGAWWWHRMVEPLAAFGLGTRAVELPSCIVPPVASVEALGDMYADADAVRSALDEEDEPVVLVGHSYGGISALQHFSTSAFQEIGLRKRSVQPAKLDLMAGSHGV